MHHEKSDYGTKADTEQLRGQVGQLDRKVSAAHWDIWHCVVDDIDDFDVKLITIRFYGVTRNIRSSLSRTCLRPSSTTSFLPNPVILLLKEPVTYVIVQPAHGFSG